MRVLFSLWGKAWKAAKSERKPDQAGWREGWGAERISVGTAVDELVCEADCSGGLRIGHLGREHSINFSHNQELFLGQAALQSC